MIVVKCTNTFSPERKYVLKLVLETFLGQTFDVQYWDHPYIKLIINNKGTIILSDHLFQTDFNAWTTKSSLPKLPLKKASIIETIFNSALISKQLPVIYGSDNINFNQNENSVECGIDLFGSIFFMLSRYEELVKPDRDCHDRFPASASLAYQEGFLDRPLVNEYLELLWLFFIKVDPSLQRKSKQFSSMITHDVDRPFEYYFMGGRSILHTAVNDILKRKSTWLSLKSLTNWMLAKLTSGRLDSSNTFRYLSEQSLKRGLVSHFYFIVNDGEDSDFFAKNYSIFNKDIQKLMAFLSKNGHQIGLHTSYNTYLSIDKTKSEFTKLLDLCKNLKINQCSWGGRQHYLRWSASQTAKNWAASGADYDSSLSFADKSGFRCGTCFSFPIFDLIDRKELDIIEVPLIAMDSTIIEKLNHSEKSARQALESFIALKNRCRMHNGTFTLLWHNSNLINKRQKQTYEAILDA